jgi:hypothetical protein
MTGVHIWLDRGGSRLYVKLADRMDNRDFHDHFIETETPQECGLIVRQLEASFEVSRLEKQEIFYWLGITEDRRPVLLK